MSFTLSSFTQNKSTYPLSSANSSYVTIVYTTAPFKLATVVRWWDTRFSQQRGCRSWSSMLWRHAVSKVVTNTPRKTFEKTFKTIWHHNPGDNNRQKKRWCVRYIQEVQRLTSGQGTGSPQILMAFLCPLTYTAVSILRYGRTVRFALLNDTNLLTTFNSMVNRLYLHPATAC